MEKGFTITYEYGENLYVNVTNRCNFNCEFCLRNRRFWMQRLKSRQPFCGQKRIKKR